MKSRTRLILLLALTASTLHAQVGTQLWTKRYDGTANGADWARAVAVDGNDNVVVTGYSAGSGGTKRDYYTAKYAAADGVLLWEKRYNSIGNGDDVASDVVVDASGNVIVTGNSIGIGSSGDYYTAKYAAADGALLWEQRYNKALNGSDGAQGLAVDSNDNVIVTGSSQNNGTGSDFDYYTAKYAAANGVLLWEQRSSGTGNGEDFATAVVVDASDNVVVTGSSEKNGNGSDVEYYTTKYAAADGALLWEKHYDGTGGGYHSAAALAVDVSGNVIVTGSSALRAC